VSVIGTKNQTDVLFSELVSLRYMNWMAMNFIRLAGCLLGLVFKKDGTCLSFFITGGNNWFPNATFCILKAS
jgi:hypothetical protein